MEALQCDGCDFRAPCYEDLKAHIQDVHTAFLQPTDVAEENNASQPRPLTTNSSSQVEAGFPPVKDEFEPAEEMPEQTPVFSPSEQRAVQTESGHYYGHNPMFSSPHTSPNPKPTNKFFQCKFCIRYFRSKSLLIEHTRKVHGGHTGSSLLSGGHLSTGPAPGSVNYNVFLHDGFGKVFSCQFCTYKSPRRARIIKHQKMYHKSSLKETCVPASDCEPLAMTAPLQETCKELPAEVVERSILESMVKPLTKSRGNFCCEWCGYQTPRRERWCDHMMKKHRNMVKIMSSLRQQQDGAHIPELHSQTKSMQHSTPNSSYLSMNISNREMVHANMSNFRSSPVSSHMKPSPPPPPPPPPPLPPPPSAPRFNPYSYPPVKPKPLHSTSLQTMDRSPYSGVPSTPNSATDIETNSMLNDSSSDDELNDLDGENHLNSMDLQSSALSGELFIGCEDDKLLETKGIPFRRFMNRFQCPFCSFLTMHRRSISRHIENIHLSGKTPVYKCEECPFTCKSSIKLGLHKQCHTNMSSEWEAISSQNESLSSMNDSVPSYDLGSMNSAMNSALNGRKSGVITDSLPHPYRCTMCNYSTTTLKGLRVHQQHKHSFCDNMPSFENLANTSQDDSESQSSLSSVQKTQTSILGLSSKNNFLPKPVRKVSSDFPLDLSPVKKRTRIDEIASNLQSKINQNKQQEDSIINVEDVEDEDEDEAEVEVELDKEDRAEHIVEVPNRAFPVQQMWVREKERDTSTTQQPQGSYRGISNEFNANNGAEIELTLSDDEEEYYNAASSSKEPLGFGMHNENSQSGSISKDLLGFGMQTENSPSGMYGTNQDADGSDFGEELGRLYYCKHCDFSNKSARSVSTHYQRMHPYIKFSFRYILDPNDHSAVYRCLECYVDYTLFEDLQQHYSEHHPEAMNVLNFNQPDLVYRCRFCSYTSPNVRSLMPHYQRMHPTVKINNAMIFSSYTVEQPHGINSESQTLREILNSAPKNLGTAAPAPARSAEPSSPHNRNTPKNVSSPEPESQKESSVKNVVVYDCDVCKFASPNMHSVLVHYQKKHPEQKASYFRIQKTMRVVSLDSSINPQIFFEDNTPSPPPAPAPPPPPAPAQDQDQNYELYYCKHCVYSNRSVVGVLVHYQKRHPEIKVTAKYVRQAPPTPALLKQLEEMQIAQPRQMSAQGSERGDNQESEMFFCMHCDYGNQTVKGVLIHYQKKHRDVKATSDMVRHHTATVRSMCDRGLKRQMGRMASPASKNDHNKPKLRALRCRQCSYTSPYIYALRKHTKKDHPELKATVTSILRWAFLDGKIEAGYHCEWCIYSHPEPNGLLMHYQRRHPEHYVDFTYMATKLWAGPDPSTGAADTKNYKCRDCTFEASSIWDITNHYQAMHPWVISRDESVLLEIIKGKDAAEKASGTVEEACAQVSEETKEETITEKVEVEEVVIGEAGAGIEEEEEEVDISDHLQEKSQQLPSVNSLMSSSAYQCTVCQSEYNNLHGLLTHYGKKHPGMKVKAADFAQDIDINPGAVYKCRHCPYINTRIHGVLTHYQKRHPAIKVTAEDFVHDIEPSLEGHLNEIEENNKISKQGYGAYRCKLCPYTHGTLEKLKIHYEKYHGQPDINMFAQSPVKTTMTEESESMPESKPPTILEVESIGRMMPPISRFSRGSHTVFRCQLCKYFCSTRKGIARHYRIKHNNVRAQPEDQTNLFKCALCTYTNPIRKGLAAHYQKRHDLDAYYTHCLAASKTVSEKSNKLIISSVTQDSSPELSEELRRAVERKKCSLCSFQSFNKKGIIAHYMRRHPGVFPKKQQASKLEGYFTIVYSEEVENESFSCGKSTVEEDKEVELLPYRCIKCFKLSFSTPELLCMHYTDHHSKDLKRDFIIVNNTTRSHVYSYQCKHCDMKLQSVEELTSHLTDHNEEFQKRAKRQERRKQLLNKQRALDSATSEFRMERAIGHYDDGFRRDKRIVGYKCKFCVEVHPTLRAICNHLRKHLKYGEVPPQAPSEKEGEVLGTTEKTASEKEGDATQDSIIAAGDDEIGMDGEEFAVENEVRQGGYPCTQCGRVLMSMQGLRSHERSHLAVAMFAREDKYNCQFCPFVSAFRHNLDRHMQTHHGHHKPFRCKLCPFKSSYNSRLKSHTLKAHIGEHTYKCSSCSFSSMTISQLKVHSLKVHRKALILPKPRMIGPASMDVNKLSGAQEPAIEGEESDVSSYSEPADVQQQLNHYQSAALAKSNNSCSPTSLPASVVIPEQKVEGALSCEFCEFTSGYIQSIRRHYRDKHGGKKLYKCKDCSFYTCFKSTFTMHVDAGHRIKQEEGSKDLRCPLCLYHTKYKRNMIDHIILHREERIVPIEVCRSKLSKHLQGIVFRCDKCTFTCSSDETLQQHIEKHNELKPYKCQLCYYETKEKDELEGHLCDEHKVSRNFELVGCINLDQLEQMKVKAEAPSSGDDEESEEEEENYEKDEEKDGGLKEESRVQGSVASSDSEIPLQEENRYPCEFCGRVFLHSLDWERHVLRHGMPLNIKPENKDGRQVTENTVMNGPQLSVPPAPESPTSPPSPPPPSPPPPSSPAPPPAPAPVPDPASAPASPTPSLTPPIMENEEVAASLEFDTVIQEESTTTTNRDNSDEPLDN